MNDFVLISLYGYLGALAVTQTVYGSHFMNARWFTLGILVIACGFYWFSTKPSAHDPSDDKSNLLIPIYFAMTFLSIVGAENPLFSGMKWISHALMLLVFLVFLRQSLKANQVNPIVLFLKVTIVTLLFASWMKPESMVSSLDLELYRGAFGSSNAMGQVAAIGALLFIHGALTGKIQWLRYLEASLAVLALWLSLVKRRTKRHDCFFNRNRSDELLLPDKAWQKNHLDHPVDGFPHGSHARPA